MGVGVMGVGVMGVGVMGVGVMGHHHDVPTYFKIVQNTGR